jgi:hypothetical protein
MIALFAFFAPAALGIPCAAHVEGSQVLLATPLAFTTGAPTLTRESALAIQGIRCLMEEEPALTIQIEVHTDSQGSDAWNLRLSQARADAIRAAILEGGPAPERITAVGYGELYPLDTNSTEAGRMRNRRIELHTEPPGSRPPRPEAPPAPVVVPVAPSPPPPSFCQRLAGLGAAVPTLPGASCQAATPGWLCSFGEPAAALAPRVQACLGGTRDGDGLYLTLPAGSLSVEPDRADARRSVLKYTPR